MTSLGCKHTDDARRRISEAHKGKPKSEETKQKLRDAANKRYADVEVRLKISAGVLVYYEKNPEVLKEIWERTKKYFEAPAARQNASDIAKKRFEDPLERKRMSDAKKNPSEETRQKLRVAQTGRKHSKESREKMSTSQRGRGPMPEHVRVKISIANGGSNHHNWKGGISSLYDQIHNCNKMCEWRQKVFGRDNYTDVESGVGGTRSNPLEAHHIIRFSELVRMYNITTLEEALGCIELWDVSNGETLIRTNHRLRHKIDGGFKNA
jgi:NUMOD3 motif